MQNLQSYFHHLSAFDPTEAQAIDRCHNVLLVGTLLSKKPRRVLELGIGTGFLTVSIIYALRYNGTGNLTCVDDWSLWGGREPDGIETIRDGGVNVVAPVNTAEYLKQCRDAAFDFIVVDGKLLNSVGRLDELARIAAEGAFLFISNSKRVTATPTGQGLIDWFKQRGVLWHQFAESTRPDEHCENGGLFAIFSQNSADDQIELEFIEKDRTIKTAAKQSSGQGSSVTVAPLFLGLVEGNNYGWGVCSQYLIQELSRLTACHVLNPEDGSDKNSSLNGKLFQALTGIDFFPMFEAARGQENFGYTFFENELNAHSIENARKYDLVLAGSGWCRDRMLEKGIANCDVLIQGIDPDIFFPTDISRQGDQFVIFSGGKFELRKGQDLVLRAVKILQDKYDDIILANCWYNIWPESMRLMVHSRHIEFEYKEQPWPELMQSVYRANGLDSSRIKTFELVPNEMQRSLYEQTDLGVFPNRCEGGTNLVMMEYMACGKPAVAANSTGQAEIVTAQNALLLNQTSPYNIAGPDNELVARWQEPAFDELVAQIEYAYHHRDEIRQLGQRAGEEMKNYTWTHTAQNLMRILFA